MNPQLIYTAAVLGSLADDSFRATRIVAVVVAKLYDIDTLLIRYAYEEDACGIDHTDDAEALLDKAAALVNDLDLACPPEVYYNDELPEGVAGRLRLEIPGTYWDADAPIYLQ